MAAKGQPKRPESVPADARWVAKDRHWVQGAGKGGSRQGLFKYWRPEGSLAHECTFKSGVQHGPFKRYHDSGEVSQEGQCVEGALHGLVVWHSTIAPTSEPRPEIAPSPLVWKTEVDYELGRVLASRHFDKQGARINADGSAIPVRPPNLPEKAVFDTAENAWVDQVLDKDGQRHGRIKSWTREGRRLEEADWEHGQKHGAVKRYGPEDKVSEEGRYRRGERTGVFRFYTEGGQVAAEREYHSNALSGHAEEYDDAGELELEETWVRGARDGVFRLKTQFWNPRVHEIQGSWRKGVPESPWSLMGHDEVPLQWLEMGTDDGPLSASPVFGDRPLPADAWRAQALQLEEKGSRNLALVALARAAAAEASVEGLMRGLSRLAIPVAGPRAEKIFLEAKAQGSAAALLSGLRTGASASMVFERLAVMLDAQGRSRAALDLVNAAVLLEPERMGVLSTRALVLISLGARDAAERDAHALASADPEQSEALLDYGRVLFCDFDFWPASTKPKVHGPVAPMQVVRSLDEIHNAVQIFATRLFKARAELLKRVVGSVPWLVPDLSLVLPDGPVKLKAFTREKKNKPVVDVDEARGLADVHEVPGLMRLARTDWAGLSWLCWAVGSDWAELPRMVAPRLDLPAAAAMSAERAWRARDRRVTHGALAKANAVPGFLWEGIDIDAVPAAMVAMPEAEWGQVHAVMKWLSHDDVASPWQAEPKPS